MSVVVDLIPGDILILIMQYLSAADLAAVARTCRAWYDLVEEFGWKGLVRDDPRPSCSLSRSFDTWTARGQAQYNTVTDTNWAASKFTARPLGQRWPGKLQPLLALNDSRLLLAAGNTIYSYRFGYSATHEKAPPVHLESVYTTSVFHPSRDITGLASVPDQNDRTLLLGYADGSLERITLPVCKHQASGTIAVDAHLVERHHFHGGSVVESIAVSSTHSLTLSSSGLAAFLPLSAYDPDVGPELVELGTRSWVTHLSAHHTPTYAAFGTTSRTPLITHRIHPTSLSPRPFAVLSSGSHAERPSAVYAIQGAPGGSPWGSSDQVLVSGWYDGVVRVHDLRSHTRTPAHTHTSADGTHTIPSLSPVLSLSDPWSFEPIYSLACGGGSLTHIAAGSARHSVVAFWDVRQPMKGWSVHAPGNDSSPVYSLVVDGARVFGANESSGFVFDFGMGVEETTYPPIPPPPAPAARMRQQHRSGFGHRPPRGMFELRDENGGPGVYVTKYGHYSGCR